VHRRQSRRDDNWATVRLGNAAERTTIPARQESIDASTENGHWKREKPCRVFVVTAIKNGVAKRLPRGERTPLHPEKRRRDGGRLIPASQGKGKRKARYRSGF